MVQANARQYRDAPALALVFSGPLAPKANWQSWLSVSEGGKQLQGEWILADDGRTLYFPNVQPDKSYEVSLKSGLGPWAPELDPQDPPAGGGGLLYRQRHGIAAASGTSPAHQRGQRG